MAEPGPALGAGSDVDTGTAAPEEPMASGQKRHYDILVVGNAGRGKSALCNTLLGLRVGETTFRVSSSMTAFTTTAQCEDRKLNHSDNTTIRVIDTPDMFSFPKEWNEQSRAKEVQKWKNFMENKSPSMVLYTVSCDRRLDPEQLKVFHQITGMIRNAWGQRDFGGKLVVAFTFHDRQDFPIQIDVDRANPMLKKFLQIANYRYLVFNNIPPKDVSQRRLNLEAVEDLKKSQTADCFEMMVELERKRHYILVVGESENGKSSMCNMLLGEEKFEKEEMKKTRCKGRKLDEDTTIRVINTPDFIACRKHFPEQEIEEEGQLWKDLMENRPPSMVLFMMRGDRMITKDEVWVFNLVRRLMGSKDFDKKLVMAFTYEDAKDHEENPTEGIFVDPPDEMLPILDITERYVVFYVNSEDVKEKESQAEECFEMMRQLNKGWSWRHCLLL